MVPELFSFGPDKIAVIFFFAGQYVIKKLLLDIAEDMKDSIPCTACRYCCEGCPKGLDIPKAMTDFKEVLAKIPSWEQICRQRDEAQKKNKMKG